MINCRSQTIVRLKLHFNYPSFKFLSILKNFQCLVDHRKKTTDLVRSSSFLAGTVWLTHIEICQTCFITSFVF